MRGAAFGAIRTSSSIPTWAWLVISVVVVAVFCGCGWREPSSELRRSSAGDAVAEKPNKAGQSWPASFGFGDSASPERIAAWDIDVGPDGRGLPPGRGTAVEGAVVYAQNCAVCHGATGVEGPDDRLVARIPDDAFPFGESLEAREAKAIGSYWPYATTLWDYTYRAMPQTAPGSLSADEVYAVTAFLLYRNQIIGEEDVIDAETLPRVVMPARDRFVPDDRAEFQEVH